MHLLAVHLHPDLHLRQGQRLFQLELHLFAVHLRTRLFLRHQLTYRLREPRPSGPRLPC